MTWMRLLPADRSSGGARMTAADLRAALAAARADVQHATDAAIKARQHALRNQPSKGTP